MWVVSVRTPTATATTASTMEQPIFSIGNRVWCHAGRACVRADRRSLDHHRQRSGPALERWLSIVPAVARRVRDVPAAVTPSQAYAVSCNSPVDMYGDWTMLFTTAPHGCRSRLVRAFKLHRPDWPALDPQWARARVLRVQWEASTWFGATRGRASYVVGRPLGWLRRRRAPVQPAAEHQRTAPRLGPAHHRFGQAPSPAGTTWERGRVRSCILPGIRRPSTSSQSTHPAISGRQRRSKPIRTISVFAMRAAQTQSVANVTARCNATCRTPSS